MAHALHRYDGACANIHGHSYRLEVTVTGHVITDPKHPKCGMIIDFGDLKQIVQTTVLDEFDHALVLNSETKNNIFNEIKNIIFVDYQPTNENLLVDFAKRIGSALPSDVSLVRLRMYETNSSFAEWTP
jgi:6-pyruvoyltetrahydropterin/6-carboxytetrahydropterin synthase